MIRRAWNRRKAGWLTAALVSWALVPGMAEGQALGPATAGPVISDYGAVFDVPFQEVDTRRDMQYRIVFDVLDSDQEPGEINRRINSVARFLNMQARAGVPVENMQLAIVLHGPAAADALQNDQFRARYGVDNKNVGLLRALGEAGVQVYMCGQSAMSRGLHDDHLVEEVQMGLSAMTVMAMLKEDGYREIN